MLHPEDCLVTSLKLTIEPEKPMSFSIFGWPHLKFLRSTLKGLHLWPFPPVSGTWWGTPQSSFSKGSTCFHGNSGSGKGLRYLDVPLELSKWLENGLYIYNLFI